MLDQDLHAHENKDTSSGKLRAAFIAGSEYIADLHSGHTKGKGDAANETDSRHNIYLQESKADTNSKGIDAGCHRQQ